jgi:hypothetical protein
MIFDYTSTTTPAVKKDDEGYYSGDLAYVPLTQSVFLLSTEELRATQGNMVTTGTQPINA